MYQTHSNILEIIDLGLHLNLPHGRYHALKNISFDIKESQTLALVGESGSGKTLIAQAIMGLLPDIAQFTNGKILFYDRLADKTQTAQYEPMNLAQLNPLSKQYQQLRGGKISIIFQEPMTSLSSMHTIGDQITEAICLHHPENSIIQAREIAAEMLAYCGFKQPTGSLKKYPFELSGGLRQRVMIAMAISCNPTLLIADEPTTALDVTLQAQILKLIKHMQKQFKMSVLMITHDLGVVANIADEVAVIYHGEIMERGSIHDVFTNPSHPYLQILLDAVPKLSTKSQSRLISLHEISIKKHRRTQDDWKRIDACNQKDPIIKIQNLSKTYHAHNPFGDDQNPIFSFKAVQNVTLEIRRGECLGLVGESGCGKTTLAKMLMGALTPTHGDIRFYKQDQQIHVNAMNKHERQYYRRHVQFVFQDPFSSLNPRMSVGEILSEPMLINTDLSHHQAMKRAAELMALVGLNPQWISRFPHSFSGGQRQRIGIARALTLNPDLILLDEPVSSLDVSVQAQILNLLKQLKDEMGLSYLFISHNLAVINYMCDRVAVMCAGRLVELAPTKSLFENTTHPYTCALLKAIPEPDLNRLINFDDIIDIKYDDSQNWPKVFQMTEEADMSLIPTKHHAHFVYANRNIF